MRLTKDQQQMFFKHQGLIGWVIKRNKLIQIAIRNRKTTWDDALQIGAYALCRAIYYYDPTKAQFTTYAVKSIKNTLLRHVIPNLNMIRWPYAKAFAIFYKNLLTKSELVKPRDIIVELGLQDTPREDRESEIEAKARSDIIAAALSRLSKTQQLIIYHRFVNCMTLQEIGDKLNCTRQNTEQLEKVAFAKLRTLLKHIND